MKQFILKRGDLVRCKGVTGPSHDLGFDLDRLYSVVDGAHGLAIQGPKGKLELFDDQGELTDHADDFAKHACPVVLPQGRVS